MQMRLKNKVLASILCMMLIVAMALGTAGCGKKDEDSPEPKATATAQADASGEEGSSGTDDTDRTDDAPDGTTTLGEGKLSFTFSVADKDGTETRFLIHTDKETVGDALLEHGLIEGDESEYGLYVKKVNGILADYDVDGAYWAFYISGEYAMTGVDSTTITDGDSYAFKVAK